MHTWKGLISTMQIRALSPRSPWRCQESRVPRSGTDGPQWKMWPRSLDMKVDQELGGAEQESVHPKMGPGVLTG